MKKITHLFVLLFLPSFVFSQHLVSISPSSATIGQTLSVTITGSRTHFTQASGTTIGFTSIQGVGNPTVNSKTILNDSSLTATITIPASAYTGYYTVSVSNLTDGTRLLNNGFHVNGIIAPSLVSITPSLANAGQTLNVTITGTNTHFTQGSGTTNVGFTSSQGVGNPVVNSKTIINDSSITANITIPSTSYTGDYNVSTNSTIEGFHWLNNGFHINGATHPTLVSISPAGAKPGQTLYVTITGTKTHFTQASGTTSIGFTSSQGVGNPIVNSKIILNDSSIIAYISIPVTANIGTYSASVYNSVTGYIYNDFYVFDNCFSHYSTAYNFVNNNFTLTLDSVTSATGATFHWDFGDGTTSALQTPVHTFALDTVYNVCLKIITHSGDSCSYCHVMGKNYAGQIFRQTGFSMNVLNYNGTTTGISQIDDAMPSITAYPNPANDMVTITTNQLASIHKPILSIYSIEGQLLLQQLFTKDKMDLDISGFARGIYLIKVTGNKKSEVIKFVKQ
jgi:hypothetical protein